MYYYFNKPKTLKNGLLAITEYGAIIKETQLLRINYHNCDYIYKFSNEQWYKTVKGALVSCEEPSLEFDDVLVKDNAFFDILKPTARNDGFFTDITKREYMQYFYRQRREQKCFPIVNRGSMWYDRLTDEQRAILEDWYDDWLNVTETLIEPNALYWVNNKTTKQLEDII